jgi:hypothetical protein
MLTDIDRTKTYKIEKLQRHWSWQFEVMTVLLQIKNAAL